MLMQASWCVEEVSGTQAKKRGNMPNEPFTGFLSKKEKKKNTQKGKMRHTFTSFHKNNKKKTFSRQTPLIAHYTKDISD